MSSTARSLSRLSLVSFNEAAILRARALQKAKLNVRKLDLCIAAIALQASAVVVTCNVRDFERVPNLVVEDWSR